MITSHYHDGLAEFPAGWLANEYYGEDVNKLADIATSPAGVATLHEATGGDSRQSPAGTRCGKWAAIAAEYALNAADQVLPLLVHEMLADPVFDVRLCAMFLVYSSPYPQPLARAFASELLASHRRRGDEHRMQRLLECLRVLGGPEERRLVEQVASGSRDHRQHPRRSRLCTRARRRLQQ